MEMIGRSDSVRWQFMQSHAEKLSVRKVPRASASLPRLFA
jgi:hypothetical protein